MGTGNLITFSAVAVLMGGTSLALGQGGGTVSFSLSERGQAIGSVLQAVIGVRQRGGGKASSGDMQRARCADYG
jgi:hypothetical protein